MRAYGALSPIDGIPLPADIVQTLLVENSSGQALGWAGSTAGSTAVGAQLVRFSGVTTAGAALNFWVDLKSTKAAAPSTGVSTEGTTGFGIPVQGVRTFQVPAGSTGYSVAALSSGYIQAELWRK